MSSSSSDGVMIDPVIMVPEAATQLNNGAQIQEALEKEG